MKTTARFVISAATGIGLAAFTITSAFVVGVDAPVTLVAFSLLAIYGLLEIAILSYASPRFEVRPPAANKASKIVALTTVCAVSPTYTSARDAGRHAA